MLLRLGSKGKQVIELQKILKLKADGDFGQITDKAVREFQKKNNIKVDGLVGPKTWSLLVSSFENKVTPITKVDNKNEDLSDPEEEIVVTNVKETLPTSPNITELIKLIESSKITRNIKELVFHCTATQQAATIQSITNYWKNNLKWSNPGYHIIVKPDGSWTYLQDFNKITNGVAGRNSTIISISYIGGVDSKGKAVDNRTKEQKEVFETIYLTFKNKLPELQFRGHNEFSNKACPCYDVKTDISEIEKRRTV
jgi:N-acetylmuramoyl-L-alanine amidase